MKKHGFTHYLKVFLLSFAFMIVLAVFSYTRKNAETGEYLYLVSSNINVQGFWANEFVLFGRTFKIGLLLIDLAAAIIFPLALTGIFLLLDIGRGKAGKKSKEELNKERYEENIAFAEPARQHYRLGRTYCDGQHPEQRALPAAQCLH